jgi:hypothetical protein
VETVRMNLLLVPIVIFHHYEARELESKLA